MNRFQACFMILTATTLAACGSTPDSSAVERSAPQLHKSATATPAAPVGFMKTKLTSNNAGMVSPATSRSMSPTAGAEASCSPEGFCALPALRRKKAEAAGTAE